MRKIKQQFGDYLDYCKNVRGMSEITILNKRSVLNKFAEVANVGRIEEIDNRIFNQWVSFLVTRGVRPRSINTYIAVVVAMLRHYLEMGYAIPIRLPLIKKMKEGEVRRRFYTASDMEIVLAYADFETGIMIRVMFETGMRIAELTNLRVENFKGRRIQFLGKGRKLREVYIRQETLDKIEVLLQTKGITKGNIFATLNGEPPTMATIRKRMRKPFFAAGFDDFYPHALRHSFATNLQLRGASVAEIKEMIGHESVATTERYLHGFEGRLEELFDKYR